MTILGFIACLMIGATIGLFLAGLCAAAKDN